MKHLFLAAAILAGPAASLASAEYMMIKIDLNKLPPPLTPNQGGPNAPRGPGGAGGPGGPRAMQPPGNKEANEPPLWATAYLQLKQKAIKRMIGKNVLLGIEHPWGKDAFVPESLGDIGSIKLYHQPSCAQRFVERRKSLEAEGKTPEKLLLLAQWALEHGLTTAFAHTMEELAKADAKHPAVLAVAKVRAAMARPVTGLDPMALSLAGELKESSENYRTVTSDGGHYALFTDLRPDRQNDVDVKKWMERLEDNYRGFFYWFALKGKALPVPTYRLVVVVVAGRLDFERKHDSYAPGPLVANGFLVRRQNVAVFSATPLDEAWERLEKYNSTEWPAFRVGRDELLSGDILKRRELFRQPMLIAKFQTLALVQKAMEKESGRAAATHEGTRQLLAATGLLSHGVVAAEWAHFGMTSFFETPIHAFYVGAGLPHWNYLVEFKYLKKTGELAKSDEVLLKTISDRYFIAANAIQQQLDLNKDGRELLEPVLEDKLMTARTTAWALTYYLAKHRLANLEQYFQELANLPRDLEFDDAVLQGCFARAFGLTESMDSAKLDSVKLARLAEAWYTAMEGESLDLLEVQSDALKERAKPQQRVPGQQPRTPPPGSRSGTRPPGFNLPPGGRRQRP